jgi:FlaA1/EpsC-like NDP-sugar epimerase
MNPIGFLDDDVAKLNQQILGLPVFGNLERLPEIARSYLLDEVLIAIPSAPGDVTRRVIDLARNANVPFRIIPALYDLVSGTVSISSIRNIEVEDLLRRDPVKLDMENIASYLEGKVVLVTGAGGSIGSELVRQICRFNPGHIILLGRGENSLFNIENQIKKTFPDVDFSTVVCDVRNSRRIDRIFQEYAPQVVFHTAAHKHVPMMERNPEEAILNNVGGTQNLVKSALEYGVQRFVNISTDKAVNPTSIMGASKRAAEMVVRRAATQAKEGQSFISVRFGNVLGSRGSVIPMFREQIRQGGPVTVTHPDMQRYFMTIPEASQLVLQAAAMNGNGSVYVLDMGEPVKIVDLAKDLIKLSGLEPYTDIDITYTGIRPGEKLFEELLTAEEGTLTTKHDKIFSAKSPTLPQDLEEKMEALFSAAHAADKNSIYKALDNLIPRSNFEYLNKMKKIKDIKDPVRSSQDISLTSKRENL